MNWRAALCAALWACEPTEDVSPAPISVATSAAALPSALPPSPPSCTAPSLLVREPFDARAAAALESCVSTDTGSRLSADRCGEDVAALDLRRFDQAVRPLDDATRAHVAALAKNGHALGRQRDVFLLVGDSMTVSGGFLRELGEAATVAPELEASLGGLVDGVPAVVARYRAPAERANGVGLDSFRASRAARVGARTEWALRGGEQSPLVSRIERMQPAVAVVLFGANDAAWRIAPPEEVAAQFERDLDALLDTLENRGVVPILNTLARHGDAPGVDDCGGELSDWRIAVQTNAVSARVVAIACRRHLPLIDLRHALDGLPGRGLGRDGVHLSTHARGGARLDASGLRCGNNVRSYVTLRMLHELTPLL